MITLVQADMACAERIHAMQVQAFMPLYEKYRDAETNPATESVERVRARLADPATRFFLIQMRGAYVGAIRVQCCDGYCRISPLFVLPEYQGQGIAQQAMRLAEKEYPGICAWRLDTILQERGNCHLYEKMGYVQTGLQHVINEKMTLIEYEKHIKIE